MKPVGLPPRRGGVSRAALVRAAIGVLLVVAVLVMGQRLFEMKAFLAALETLQVEYMVPIALLALVYYALKALRWYYYLGEAGIHVPLWRAGAAYLAGQWFMFTPAGELTRAYFLGGGVSFAAAAPTVIVQALADFFALAVVALAVLPAYPVLAPLVLPVALPLVALMLVLAAPAVRRHAARWQPLGWRGPQQLRALLDQSTHLLGARQTGTGLLLGVPAVFVGALALHLAGLAVGSADWAIGQTLGVYTLMQLVGGLSASPHGLGVTEGSGLLLLAYVGVEGGTALAAVVLFRATLLGLGMMLGGVALVGLRIADRGPACPPPTAAQAGRADSTG